MGASGNKRNGGLRQKTDRLRSLCQVESATILATENKSGRNVFQSGHERSPFSLGLLDSLHVVVGAVADHQNRLVEQVGGSIQGQLGEPTFQTQVPLPGRYLPVRGQKFILVISQLTTICGKLLQDLRAIFGLQEACITLPLDLDKDEFAQLGVVVAEVNFIAALPGFLEGDLLIQNLVCSLATNRLDDFAFRESGQT